MKNIDRLLITLLIACVISILPKQMAEASEITINAEATIQEESQQNEVTTNEVVKLDEASVTETGIHTIDATMVDTETEENADKTDNLQSEVDLDNFALEGFEIIMDEQGQIYYVEKEPEPVEIIEQPEEAEEANKTTEKTKVEPEKEKKEKAKPSYSEKELRLLASLVYAEAGNQSYNGMLAVANVVLNRVHSDVYYHVDTIKEVIYDKKWSVQFAVTVKSKKTGLSMLDKALNAYDTGNYTGRNPEAEQKAMKKAIKAAKAALEGENNIGNYLCFNAVNRSTGRIKAKYSDYKIIGDHIFYRTK